MWKAIRENPRAVTYAVLMHLVLLMVGLDWTPKSIKPGVKTPIEAELVSNDKLKAIEERKQAEKQRAEQQAAAERKKQAEAEARKQAEAEQKLAAEKAAIEKKIQAEAAARKQAEAEQQRKAEAAAAEKKRQEELAAKQKAEAERKKAEAEKKRKAEEAARKKAEAERKAEAARQAEAEAALRAQLAEEEARARAESALAEYIPYIQDKVQRNWLRPPGSPPGLSCLVKVRLIPGGEVASVSVVRSSGDSVFDRSVETAVLKASPLPLPEDAEMFKHFREINFNFDPGR